jgi:lipase
MAVLHAHRLGDAAGPPLLAIHGITGHGLRYRRLAEEGWPHRATLAVDLRGHGRSTTDAPWNIEQHVADLVDTMDARAADDPHWRTEVDVVGHSYGGAIGLHLNRLHPERVRRLVMLDPAFARSGAFGAEMARSTMSFAGFATRADAVAQRAAGLAESGHWVLDEEIDAHLDTDATPMRFRFDVAAIVAGWGEICRPVPTVARPAPTLLVIAQQAGIVTPDVVDALGDGLGAALTTETIDCGHMLYWERFADTVAAVERFLG